MTLGNSDAEKLRLQNLIRDGLQPRLPSPPEMESVITEEGKLAFVVRIPKSWRSPHRVSFGGHGHFYARHSNGKYQLDVGELRDAMVRGESVSERIRAFRAERVISVKSGNTPIVVEDAPTQIVHLVPLSAFTSGAAVDISTAIRRIASSNLIPLKPLGRSSGWDHHVNLEGRVVFGVTGPGDANGRSYTQYYRNGIFEAVGTLPIGSKASPTVPYIFSADWVYELRDFLARSFALMKQLESELPIVFFFSLTGIRGVSLSMDSYIGAIGNPFKTDDLVLGEQIIETYPPSVDPLLKRILGIVWNAAGLEDCLLFDSEGKLLPPQR